jgi:hypothetical protein
MYKFHYIFKYMLNFSDEKYIKTTLYNMILKNKHQLQHST